MQNATAKPCSTCKVVKPLSDFGKSSSAKGGLEPRCRDCRSTDARQDMERKRLGTLARRYGVTPEQLSDLLAAQGGVCAICKRPESMTRLGTLRNLCVDHCHQTGMVRGLLCAKCNMAIGHLTDDPTVIHAAAEYLRGIEKE